jgi:LytS/YehU family sensor histidine kinase
MEMEMTALRAQMNPHFIFNAISSIQNFILHNENDAANHYLLLFSRLMRNVLEHSKEEVITLQQENEMLQQYLEIESLRFKGRFKWQIELPDNIPHGEILLPPLLLQPFVENALWHGLIPLEKQGVLHIHIRAENEQLICVIEDNGIGREASALQKHSTEKKRSLSTSINRERIEDVEQVSGRQARLDITDLYTPEGTPCGTRVTIILPLMKLS